MSIPGEEVIAWVRSQWTDAPAGSPAYAWEAAGWGSALDLYQWARKAQFVDVAGKASPIRRELVSRWLREDPPPPPFAPGRHDIRLTDEPPRGLPDLRDAALARRTTRKFDPAGSSIGELSWTLRNGLAEVRRIRRIARAGWEADNPLAALVSFGACIETYVITFRVAGLDSGVYHYDIDGHALARVAGGDLRKDLMSWLQGQVAPMTAAWTIVLVGDYGGYQWRYRHDRALLNLHIEAGRIGQWLTMAGCEQGLQALPTPAFIDSKLAAALRLPGLDRAGPIHSLTMGHPHPTTPQPTRAPGA
ncbi:MAG TPA: SagB/ThcOx family dehydrogenase [Natronosporangium sp.]